MSDYPLYVNPSLVRLGAVVTNLARSYQSSLASIATVAKQFAESRPRLAEQIERSQSAIVAWEHQMQRNTLVFQAISSLPPSPALRMALTPAVQLRPLPEPRNYSRTLPTHPAPPPHIDDQHAVLLRRIAIIEAELVMLRKMIEGDP
jgi:hypothetical protein